MQRVVAVLVAVAGLGLSRAAPAEDRDESPQGDYEGAREAFEEGVVYFDAGKYEAAADAFRRANALHPSWKLQYNIGQCEAALRRYGLAIESFERYLAEGGDDVLESRHEEVLAEIRRLRDIVGSIEVSAPEGAVVLVDGVMRGSAPLVARIRIAAGVDHQLVVQRGVEVLLERQVRVGGREILSLEVDETGEAGEEVLRPSPSEEEPPVVEPVRAGGPEASEEEDRLLPTLAWIGAGLTVAAGGGGFGFWLAAESRDEDFQASKADVEAGRVPYDDAEADLIDAHDDTKLYDDVATALFISAGVLAAGTAAVLIAHFAGDGEGEGEGDVVVSAAPGGVVISF